ncbi:MAG: hypothetical protein LBC43_05110 [Bifidobacteriaceae bacterium]|nr:hypothetical protein [Bifidobacteriaceae bacterium]
MSLQVLVDTSVWIEHWRHSNVQLVKLLRSNQVISHEFILQELLVGNLSHSSDLFEAFINIPYIKVVDFKTFITQVDRIKNVSPGFN